MLQSVMLSDLHAYDFSFFSRKEMGKAVKGLGEKVSFALLASWGRGLLRTSEHGPLNAHMMRDISVDA
jgi:hypothetical protein